MIKTKEQIHVDIANNDAGNVILYFSDLADFPGKNENLRTFAFVELQPGEEVAYHIHTGESESYYIVSGEGIYDDNGKTVKVSKGTVTFTPSGQGHGIKNTGKEILKFIALILVD